MPEVAFPGLPEFSDGSGFGALLWLVMRGPPYLYRMVITEQAVRIDGRGSFLRVLLPRRSCDLDALVSVRLRGTLVILYLPNDAW